MTLCRSLMFVSELICVVPSSPAAAQSHTENRPVIREPTALACATTARSIPAISILPIANIRRISVDEWHFDRESFRRADPNRDNVISRSEFLSEDDLDDDRGDNFSNLDADGDRSGTGPRRIQSPGR